MALCIASRRHDKSSSSPVYRQIRSKVSRKDGGYQIVVTGLFLEQILTACVPKSVRHRYWELKVMLCIKRHESFTILRRARIISQIIHCISVKLLKNQPHRAGRQSARQAVSSASSRLP
jgi:hypothetical protein